MTPDQAIPIEPWSLIIPPAEPEELESPYTYYAIVLDPVDGWINTVGVQFSIEQVAKRLRMGWRIAGVTY